MASHGRHDSSIETENTWKSCTNRWLTFLKNYQSSTPGVSIQRPFNGHWWRNIQKASKLHRMVLPWVVNPNLSNSSLLVTLAHFCHHSGAHLCHNFFLHQLREYLFSKRINTKASDPELWCFLWSTPEKSVEQTIETVVIWDTFALSMTSLLSF